MTKGTKHSKKTKALLQGKALKMLTHFEFKHGHSRAMNNGKTHTYRCWIDFRRRVNDPTNKYYFGLGYETRWDDFREFLNDIGIIPDNCVVHRIDPNRGYYQDNILIVDRQAHSWYHNTFLRKHKDNSCYIGNLLDEEQMKLVKSYCELNRSNGVKNKEYIREQMKCLLQA